MRKFIEPTARNLLRTPLVLGAPPLGLATLSFGVIGISFLGGSSLTANSCALGVGGLGYIALRLLSRFAKVGWEEELIWWIETRFGNSTKGCGYSRVPGLLEITSPDTLDETQLIQAKETLRAQLEAIKPGRRRIFLLAVDAKGWQMLVNEPRGAVRLKGEHKKKPEEPYVYSLYQLPASLDPRWLFAVLSVLKCEFSVSVRLDGLDPRTVKRQLEVARRNTARGDEGLSNIDAEVAFEDSSDVLRQLSRGEEKLVRLSLVISAKEPLSLDESYFCLEKRPLLASISGEGYRRRFFRSHVVRVTTACDLIPNLGDPQGSPPKILTTLRGFPLYFNPRDSRLEALHWLVVGATGSGKSFFTGLMLKRMLDQQFPMSVLFIDHNRSFKRLVTSTHRLYFEPNNLESLEDAMLALSKYLGSEGTVMGIELSELDCKDKKAAISRLFVGIQHFLRSRLSTHPVYVVLDESWSYLRHEPDLIQQAFREFRKFNGAMVAITQSLSDFLTDESGQTIFQNTPVRVLLRQGEDISQFQRMLGLNAVELDWVRFLKQERGKYSECLIKTPFLSRVGRLYPTEAEHDLLRTDNLREEWVAAQTKPGLATKAKSHSFDLVQMKRPKGLLQ